jgi:hypothetical protein
LEKIFTNISLIFETWRGEMEPSRQGSWDQALNLKERKTMPLDVYGIPRTAIGEYFDMALWLCAGTTSGVLEYDDPEHMVRLVLDKAEQEKQKIGRLNIMGHGNATQIQLGRKLQNVVSVGSYRPVLKNIKNAMAPNGFVHCWHCFVGANTPMMTLLADIFQVDVYGGTGTQIGGFGLNLGTYVMCAPDGTLSTQLFRPRMRD